MSEDPFVLVAISEYGHEPTAQEVSDEELSKLCNEVLLSDLKALALLPNALAAFKTVTDGGAPMALSIGGDLLMRMTWEEIVKAYPKQYVALVDAYPDIYKLESAVVVHSEKDMSESDLLTYKHEKL